MWTKEIWPQATEIANVIGSQLRAQRCIPRQTMMANISGSDEDFFKISIGIKMLYFVISDLKTRFGPDQLMVSKRFFPDGGRTLKQEIPVLITAIQVMQEQNAYLNFSSPIYPFILIYSFYNQPIIGNKNLVLII